MLFMLTPEIKTNLILKEIGIKKIILLSNSNKKIIALDGFDIEIAEQQKI